jgi:peptidoglycan hydrolase CwlO-like protein
MRSKILRLHLALKEDTTMEITVPTNITEWFSTVVLALAGLAVGLQLLVKHFKSNNTESALLTMMHTELERMSSQNSVLSQEVGKLQIEIVKLSTQLTELTLENQKLQAEINNLNREIIRLHGFITQKENV